MTNFIMVRHSNFRAGLHPEFERQVEEKPCSPDVMAAAVAAGGLAETSYAEALDLVREINTGAVPGRFEKFTIVPGYDADLFVPTT